MKRYFKSVEGKLFLLLGTILSAVGIVAVTIHSQRRIEARESARTEKYEQALALLSSSILQFERDAEAKMWLALQHLKHDDLPGTPSTRLLKKRARELGMSHFFIVDQSGRFIRSTNESPELIPRLFSFSDEYRSLPFRSETPVATPLIPPDPEVRPYKFLTVFHHSTGRFLHAGLRADYLETALTRMVAADPEILEIHILSPNGTSLGRFERGVFNYGTERIRVPEWVTQSGSALKSKEGMRLLLWTDSSHPDCGQCRKSGDLRNGRHQYLFSILIKNEVHSNWVREESLRSRIYSSIWSILGLTLAYGLAKGFTRRIRLLNSLVARSRLDRVNPGRIELKGADEVSDLAFEFQALVDRIDEHQRQALLAERGKIELQVAMRVAHDLRSPLTTLGLLIHPEDGSISGDPEIFKQAIRRIREVADSLLERRDPCTGRPSEGADVEFGEPVPFFPALAIERIISEKRVEYSGTPGCVFTFKTESPARYSIASAPPGEFERMMSNLINNAIEAYPAGKAPSVEVSLGFTEVDRIEISIRDRGKGMPEEFLVHLGERGFTRGKASGNGIGFHHASQLTHALGGEISVRSSPGQGTEVRLLFKRMDQSLPCLPGTRPDRWESIILVDDDPLICQAWSYRSLKGMPIRAFESPREFKQFYAKNFDALEKTLILMDHEFRLEPCQTGLDLLSELSLEGQALLVTARYDDPDLLKQALRAGIRVCPKIILGDDQQKAG